MSTNVAVKSATICRKPIVYLAGGFRSGWQSVVHEALAGEVVILDPSQHSLGAPSDYTAWDLDAIRQSDCVLAYMEASNPGGFALALEIGYAHALGKEIVLVDNLDDERSKYFTMVREVASVKALDLITACRYIRNHMVSSLNRSL